VRLEQRDFLGVSAWSAAPKNSIPRGARRRRAGSPSERGRTFAQSNENYAFLGIWQTTAGALKPALSKGSIIRCSCLAGNMLISNWGAKGNLQMASGSGTLIVPTQAHPDLPA